MGIEKLNPYASAAAVGLRLIGGAANLFGAAKKDKAAARIYANTKRPIYNRQEEVDNIANLTEAEIQNTSIADQAERQARLGLSQGIDAILKSGGKADFNSVYGNYGQVLNTAVQQMNVERSRKIAAANEAAYALAKAKDAEFQYNEAAPFADKMKQAAQLKDQAAKQRADGWGNITGAAANAAVATNKPGDYGPKDDGGGEDLTDYDVSGGGGLGGWSKRNGY